MHAASSQADGHASDAVADRVIAEIAATLDLELAEVLPGCQLRDDFGARKDDYILLWRALETEFSLTIPLHQVDRWKDVATVIAYIESRVNP